MTNKPIAVLYEHPDWFQPLFVELERRDVPFERMNVRDHSFDPAVQRYPYSLVVNRVSAFPSGGAHQEIVLYVKEYLAYLDSIQASVINGYVSYLVGSTYSSGSTSAIHGRASFTTRNKRPSLPRI
jgi:hypothetical protein